MTDAGTVMGEYMFLGLRTTSQAGRRCGHPGPNGPCNFRTERRSEATFRVATPLVVMLWISHHSFENILSDGYPSEPWLQRPAVLSLRI